MGRKRNAVLSKKRAHNLTFVFFISALVRCSPHTAKMKYLVAFAVFALAFAAEEKAEEERPKTFRRLIPADVLRGQCFM